MADTGRDHIGLSDLIAWAFERWPFAVIVICALGFLYYGMVFESGPAFIRPASAQSVNQQVAAARREIAAQVSTLEQAVHDVSNKQDDADKRDHADRIERLEQQLLWWRQQNCKSKGEARNYTWKTMSDLKDRYALLKGSEWQMPTCSDIGE